MTDLIIKSLQETLLMVGLSTLFSIALGVPLAILLFATARGGLCAMPWVNHLASFLINAFRSIPYIILMVIIMPFTKLMTGSTIGTLAAIVPLTVAGMLLVARVVEDCLKTVPSGLIEVGLAYGARKTQIIRSILLAESLPHLVSGITTVIINLIGFSAMAGAVGGGGLGDLAIRYGYQRYDITLMMIIVAILVILVQGVQVIGNTISKKLTR